MRFQENFIAVSEEFEEDPEGIWGFQGGFRDVSKWIKCDSKYFFDVL